MEIDTFKDHPSNRHSSNDASNDALANGLPRPRPPLSLRERLDAWWQERSVRSGRTAPLGTVSNPDGSRLPLATPLMERPVAAVLVTALLAAGCVLVLPMAWQWARGGSQPTVDAALPVLTAADVNASPISPPSATPAATEALPLTGDGEHEANSPAGETPPDPTPVVVHVAGAVRTSGVVELIEPARVIDAITAAGGPSSTAALERLNLAEHVADGQRIWVPAVGDGPEVEVVPLATPRPTPGPRATEDFIDTAPAVGSAPVAVNSATAAELETLPGIGPVMAAAIVDHRNREGPFATVDGLLDVSGIGTVRLETLRAHIVIS